MLIAAEPGTLIFLILVVPLLVLLAKGLANPRSRPFLLGLLAVGLAAFVFLGFVAVRHTRMSEFDQVRIAEESQRATFEQMRRAEENQRATAVTPPPPPGYSSFPVPPPPGYSSMQATEAVTPRKAKTSGTSAQLAKAKKSDTSKKPDTSAKPATPPNDELDDAAPEPPPAWVKAEPKKQGDVYLMTRQTDPYTTTLECEREVPKALQSAVSEYAQLLLGSDQAKNVRLPESDLRHLERARWPESRKIDIGGETKEMVTVHLLIGFDAAMQQQIRMTAENAIVAQRLKGAGVVLGGVLGLLALVWGGLSLTGSRQDANLIQEAAAPVAVKARTKPVITIVSVACVFAVIIALATLFGYLYLG